MLLVAGILVSEAQDRSGHMAPGNQAETLSGDLVPSISQPDTSMIIAQLEDARWTRRTEQGLEIEIGSVDFRVMDAVHGTKLHPQDLIQVPASRIASPTVRVRNRSNYWNAVRLNPHDTFILACRPTDDPRVWKAMAARQVSSSAAGDVSAVRKAYEIEEFSGSPAENLKLLGAALQSDLDLLNRFALNYLERQDATQRDSAVQLLHDAILSSKVASDRKLNLAVALSGQPFLLREGKADSANQMVIGTLATALVNETDSANRSTWARILSASVLAEFTPDPQEASRIRSSLMRSPQDPPPARVTAALSDLAAHSSGEEKEIVSRLLKAWQSAGQ
jgi:hypothetical protein